MYPLYHVLCQRVLTEGQLVAPATYSTRELRGVEIQTAVGEMPTRIHFNPRLAIVEGLALVAGIPQRDAVAAVAPKVNPLLFTAQAAYGPRLMDQMPHIINELAHDPDSRRAVGVISRSYETASASLPCAQLVQFLIRDDALFAQVYMRSSDLIWGLPYDIVQFGFLTACLARCFTSSSDGDPIIPVDVCFHLASAHIYASTAHLAPVTPPSRLQLFQLQSIVPRKWPHLREWANDCLQAIIRTGNIKGHGIDLVSSPLLWPTKTLEAPYG